ncbi:MAG: hypothetical protein Q8N26_09595 [Myxococcales bacterium]|nr:hypothetical protein [Myxococcales bacterium]
MRGLVVGWCLLSVVAEAQPQPVVAPYPFEVLTRGIEPAKVEELQSVASRLLSNAGVSPQPKGMIKNALERLKRQDCGTEDDCLRQLATLSDALYGLYFSVAATPTAVTVAGRVVRDDGKRVAGPEQIVEERKAKEPIDATMKRALPKLFAALKLSQLPAVREVVTTVKPSDPVKPPDLVNPPPAVDAGVVGLPPPPPPPVEESVLRPAGIVTAIAGGALAAGGTVMLIVGRAQADAVLLPGGVLKPGGSAEDATTARNATSLQSAGVAVAGLGVAAIGAGLVMLLMAPAEPVKTSVFAAPMPGGAAVFVTGVLP